MKFEALITTENTPKKVTKQPQILHHIFTPILTSPTLFIPSLPMKNTAPLHHRARCYKVSPVVLALGYRKLDPPPSTFKLFRLFSIMFLPDYQ